MPGKAAFIHCEELEQYPYPADCPFKTNRAGRLYKVLQSMNLLDDPDRMVTAPTKAERVELKKFHSARYLRVLKNADDGKWDTETLEMGIGTSDCPIFKGMYDYSALACGASLKGVEMILAGKAHIAFNPSGGLHHAMSEKAAGFCYLNDVALACMKFAEAKKRVLYLDVDVHHGDGVVYAFYSRSDVMAISMHETGRLLFPGTGFEDEIGTGEGKGYSVNIPLPPGTYDSAYMKAFNELVKPLAGAFNPDVIVFELGADALAGDPLAHLSLTNNTYARIISFLLSLNKPILATGGGGYNIDNTVRAWALAWSVLCGGDNVRDANVGLGGVMLESTDWHGGLYDRELIPSREQRRIVEPAIDATIEKIKTGIFGIHGL